MQELTHEGLVGDRWKTKPSSTSPDGGPDPRKQVTLMNRFAAQAVAGTRERLCTDIVRATGGRLFAKLGGEAVYVVGVCGADRALAIKLDDGALRGLHAVVVELLERRGYLRPSEVAALAGWKRPALTNWAGRVTGHIEVSA